MALRQNGGAQGNYGPESNEPSRLTKKKKKGATQNKEKNEKPPIGVRTTMVGKKAKPREGGGDQPCETIRQEGR